MLTIAVDAMGGDHAPKSEVEGAIRAASELQVSVILVGQEDVVRAGIGEASRSRASCPSKFSHAAKSSPWRTRPPRPSAPRRIHPSTWPRAWCATASAQGVVSAGNTGAVMATAKMVQGMIRGVERPALASAFPTLNGNARCGGRRRRERRFHARNAGAVRRDGRNLFAHIFSQSQSPRVGLLSIGEEEHKGNDLTRAATAAAQSAAAEFHRQRGRAATFIRGHRRRGGLRRLHRQRRAEGERRPGGDDARACCSESLEATVTRKLGYVLSREAYREFRKRVDYSEYGGAPLLGVKGVSIICHGRSNANAIKNAIRVAAEFAHGQINEKIEAEIRGSPAADRSRRNSGPGQLSMQPPNRGILQGIFDVMACRWHRSLPPHPPRSLTRSSGP